jgi:selenocysteine lyase/cysteine desulfurase
MNPTVSFRLQAKPLGGIADAFAARGVWVRVGTHCAPTALRALDSAEGCVRVSLGWANGSSDIDRFVAALGELMAEHR